MDERRLKQRQEKAQAHDVRAAMLDALGAEELTPAELRPHLPDDMSASAASYHLAVLLDAELVACVGGVYRAA